jgi:uncharacterized membrane protein YciS (DUF1049 family)
MSFPNPFRHWKILLLMGAIFSFGLISGSVLTARFLGKIAIKVLSMEGWSERTVKDLKHQLQLTQDQEIKIRTLAKQHQPEVMALRNETFAKFGGVHKQLNEEILPLLTSEQATKLRALTKRREAGFKQTFKLNASPAASSAPR